MNTGYDPPTPELNTDEGVLEITSPAECELIEDSKIIAETLILRCVLRPIPLKDQGIKVHLIVEGDAKTEIHLYDKNSVTYGFEREIENSQWQGIALEYTGVGRGIHQGTSFVIDGRDLRDGHIAGENPLYIKPFLVETQNHIERLTTVGLGQILTSPPGVLNTHVLRGYGGYYKEGIAFEDIQQIYYSLSVSEGKTRVRLFTSSKLQDQHTPPPFGGRDFNYDVIFNPVPREENYLSLSGALAAGHARLSVSTNGGVVTFSSFLGEPVSGHPGLINVFFKPHKENSNVHNLSF